jgi:hypothetical protein
MAYQTLNTKAFSPDASASQFPRDDYQVSELSQPSRSQTPETARPVSPTDNAEKYQRQPLSNVVERSPPNPSPPSSPFDGTKHVHLSKTQPLALAADAFAVGVPLGLLVFLIVVLRKDGVPATEDSIRQWKNAASIVRRGPRTPGRERSC